VRRRGTARAASRIAPPDHPDDPRFSVSPNAFVVNPCGFSGGSYGRAGQDDSVLGKKTGGVERVACASRSSFVPGASRSGPDLGTIQERSRIHPVLGTGRCEVREWNRPGRGNIPSADYPARPRKKPACLCNVSVPPPSIEIEEGRRRGVREGPRPTEYLPIPESQESMPLSGEEGFASRGPVFGYSEGNPAREGAGEWTDLGRFPRSSRRDTTDRTLPERGGGRRIEFPKSEPSERGGPDNPSPTRRFG